MKILHIADIHWRGLSRHEEYTASFNNFFDQCREILPDLIYVGGDIVHSKTQGISPELIDRLSWWFTKMAEICPVHVILGNHDGLILNKDRQDAISPIISALDNPNIFLYKDSGVYSTGFDGVNWCVFSCFDEVGWKDVRPVAGDINIALFHGAVWGSKTDVDWEIEGDVTVDLFENFEFAMLGDIHRRQFLNEKKTIAYCGSTIQQNYGEDVGKGFLLWDIKSKDDFSCEYYEIPHCSPFVTIDWKDNVENTLVDARKEKAGSRFRIRSKSQITQADSQEISTRLRQDMMAKEVVFKSENQFDASSFSIKSENKEVNLRDISTQHDLFENYFNGYELTQEEKDDLNDLVEKYFSQSISSEVALRNSRWEIERMMFDNLFAYGDNNQIDFTKNTGITGIFGKNTKGKSSIIGSLMYCLFNTTDRGPIKNIHIVNSRKKFASSSVDIKLNGEILRITRGTVKHTTRKGEEYASTSLELQKVGNDGEVIENLTEEQRRETEKVLRNLIGTPEDFLMTSLASQGGMNRFIGEGSTARKGILTKFLDLDIFDKMSDFCKQDYSSLKSFSRSIKKEDWDTKIEEEKLNLKSLTSKLQETRSDTKSSRKNLADLRNQISQIGVSSNNYYTASELDEKKEEIENLSDKILKFKKSKSELSTLIAEKREKLSKIQLVCESTSIEDLKDQKRAQVEIEKSLLELQGSLRLEKRELESIKKLAKKLEPCDCFVHKPDCKYITKSQENNERLERQTSRVEKSMQHLKECQSSLDIIKKINPGEKVRKYEALFLKSRDLSSSIELESERESNICASVARAQEKLKHAEREKEKMVLFLETHKETAIAEIQDKISAVSRSIDQLEKNQVKTIEKIAESKLKIKSLEADYENHNQLKRQMKIYDLFSQAVSKKGIPTRIMSSKLPVINSEILNILQGVVEFTVLLETDPSTNTMDIYIDYGDSRRVIELASGMEKMIASLAIRVALINTSSLSKTNMMIIDEGFGSLDATNLEACTRLLESLKKWFRNIIVISHVDAVKDCVDNSVEIIKKGKDSYVKFV